MIHMNPYDIWISNYESRQEVLNSIVNYHDKEHMIVEQMLLDGKYVQESGDLHNRIWQTMKKTLKVTDGIMSHITNMLGGLFHIRKHKSSKTPSGIANEVIPNPKLPKEQQELEKNLKTPFKGKESIVLSDTPIFIKELTEDEGLYIGLIGVNYTKDENGKLKHISNSDGVRGLEDNAVVYKNTVYYIKHPEGLENLTKIVENAVSLMDKNTTIDQRSLRKEIENQIHKSHRFGREFNAGGTKITMKDLTAFSARINKLTNATDKIQNGNNSVEHLESETIQMFNRLVRELETCQHGLNMLSNEIGKLYLIKAQYVNSIKDKNNLAKFVEMCIDAGVPPKFIAYNTWLIANEEIRGDKTDFEKVPMGQTRMVFFPKDKSIITKIAFSGRGLTSNKNEVRMSEFIQRSGEEEVIKMIAPIKGHYGKDCAVIDMERVVDKVGKHPNPKQMLKIVNDFKDFTKRHPELRLVVKDINDGNIMWSSDRECWVCIDYGIGQRDDTDSDKMKKHADEAAAEYMEKTGKEIKNVTEYYSDEELYEEGVFDKMKKNRKENKEMTEKHKDYLGYYMRTNNEIIKLHSDINFRRISKPEAFAKIVKIYESMNRHRAGLKLDQKMDKVADSKISPMREPCVKNIHKYQKEIAGRIAENTVEHSTSDLKKTVDKLKRLNRLMQEEYQLSQPVLARATGYAADAGMMNMAGDIVGLFT